VTGFHPAAISSCGDLSQAMFTIRCKGKACCDIFRFQLREVFQYVFLA
jgi:hypothetical protein